MQIRKDFSAAFQNQFLQEKYLGFISKASIDGFSEE
jgi:hypothetical protein